MSRAPSTEALERAWLALVRDLVTAGTLKTPRVIHAFERVPRFVFVPPELKEAAASVDAPLPIGYGQTVSQPTTVATMLELVQPQPGDRALDVGTGSGWQAAVLADCVQKPGRVVTVERVAALGEEAAKIFERLDLGNVIPLVGDATAGVAEHGPYNVIVSAAGSAEIPQAWVHQLAPGGRLLHPIAGMGLRLVKKNHIGKLTTKDYPGYVFVPLVYDEGKT